MPIELICPICENVITSNLAIISRNTRYECPSCKNFSVIDKHSEIEIIKLK